MTDILWSEREEWAETFGGNKVMAAALIDRRRSAWAPRSGR
jgi:hypothetical protein